MISFEESLRIVASCPVRPSSEKVPLAESAGRILFEDAVSDIDMPPFDRSAMDGYACRKEDLESRLRVVGTIPAGMMPTVRIGRGECAKIMTGAIVPEGADTVVMVEDTVESGGLVTVTRISGAGNIAAKGEDLKAGDVVLRKGTRIGPPETAVLAAAGHDPVTVAKRPVVGIIATGDELVEPSEKPSGAKIRNSNSLQIAAQAAEAGFVPLLMGTAQDDSNEISRLIESGEGRVDIFILSGGVSMGDYDFVPDVLSAGGFEILFSKVAVKPGKPTLFARRRGQFAFGLPGNPVSAFLIFEIFVRPLGSRMMGCDYWHPCLEAPLGEAFIRRKSGRTENIPVIIDRDGQALLVEYHGSAHIHAFTLADGFITVPPGVREIPRGESVKVTLTRQCGVRAKRL